MIRVAWKHQTGGNFQAITQSYSSSMVCKTAQLHDIKTMQPAVDFPLIGTTTVYLLTFWPIKHQKLPHPEAKASPLRWIRGDLCSYSAFIHLDSAIQSAIAFRGSVENAARILQHPRTTRLKAGWVATKGALDEMASETSMSMRNKISFAEGPLGGVTQSSNFRVRSCVALVFPYAPEKAPSDERQPDARDRACCCRPAYGRGRTHAPSPPPRVQRCVLGSRCIASNGSATHPPELDTFGRCLCRPPGIAAALSCTHAPA